MKSKLVIIIAGNIASGKSSLAKVLAQKLAGFTILSMDAERWASSGEGLAREQAAGHALLQKLLQHERIIYETTAFGKNYQVAMRLLAKEKAKLVQLKLHCHPDECLRRYRERGYHPPMPFQFEIEDSLWKIHANLQRVPGITLDSQQHSPEALATQIL
ncbi:MAG: AAA family ATPase [Flammeovirgaceae bacterium]